MVIAGARGIFRTSQGKAIAYAEDVSIRSYKEYLDISADSIRFTKRILTRSLNSAKLDIFNPKTGKLQMTIPCKDFGIIVSSNGSLTMWLRLNWSNHG
jgi:hypothetical protein